jgi:hypothetical protein
MSHSPALGLGGAGGWAWVSGADPSATAPASNSAEASRRVEMIIEDSVRGLFGWLSCWVDLRKVCSSGGAFVIAQKPDSISEMGRYRYPHGKQRDFRQWSRTSREPNAPAVADVAAAVAVQPSRLTRDFRKFLGFAPADFVEDVLLRGRFTY